MTRLGVSITMDYDAERVAKGMLTTSKRVATVHVTGWEGITEIELLDVIDDIRGELPRLAEEAHKLRLGRETTGVATSRGMKGVATWPRSFFCNEGHHRNCVGLMTGSASVGCECPCHSSEPQVRENAETDTPEQEGPQ